MNNEQERALSELRAAASVIHKNIGGKAGTSGEKIYGQAYNRCVALGIKPKLRKKYT
jgi:hypothetical protein